MKNDVSLLVDSVLSLWEQQSSFNPNMPIRGLMYFGGLYEAYIEKGELNIYGSKLVKLPTPKYIVFYNGSKDIAPVEKLKLSDAFVQSDNSGEFEWTATVYNLNRGKNVMADFLKKHRAEVMSVCLTEYNEKTFVNGIREEGRKEGQLSTLIDLVKDGFLTVLQAAERFGVSEEEFKKLIQ